MFTVTKALVGKGLRCISRLTHANSEKHNPKSKK